MSGAVGNGHGWIDFVTGWAAVPIDAAKDSRLPEHVHTLVPQRLACAGLDAGYEAEAEPELFGVLKSVCGTCTHTAECNHDFTLSDASERVSRYCPNTPIVDDLIIARAMG